MTAIEYLDQQVKQLVPGVEGISIGTWDDATTWKVAGKLTPEQVQAIDIVFKSFDKAAFDATQVPLKSVEERLSVLEALQARVVDLEIQIRELNPGLPGLDIAP